MRASGAVRRLVLFGLSLSLVPGVAAGQGCMPLKFLSPSLAGLQSAYLRAGEWRVGLGVRRVSTDKMYLGDGPAPSAVLPGGQPLFLKLNSVDLSATYAVSERVSLTATVPFSYSSQSLFYPDGIRHETSSGGVGDVNLMANAWVFAPGSHVNGNLYVGLGMKAPTGSYHATGEVWDSTGASTQAPVPQTIQQGDGGFAILAQVQAYQQLFTGMSAYLSGDYSASLRQHTDVLWPQANALWAVPDVYSARAGLSYAALPQWGLAVSAGWRADGTTSKDVFHAAGDFYRHAGYTMYLEPGLSLIQGPNQFNLTVPIRVRANYLTVTTSAGPRPGAGGVNDYVIYASWSRRM